VIGVLCQTISASAPQISSLKSASLEHRNRFTDAASPMTARSTAASDSSSGEAAQSTMAINGIGLFVLVW
jgi:hypothetical protein